MKRTTICLLLLAIFAIGFENHLLARGGGGGRGAAAEGVVVVADSVAVVDTAGGVAERAVSAAATEVVMAVGCLGPLRPLPGHQCLPAAETLELDHRPAPSAAGQVLVSDNPESVAASPTDQPPAHCPAEHGRESRPALAPRPAN
jgi:hypothetical protein